MDWLTDIFWGMDVSPEDNRGNQPPPFTMQAPRVKLRAAGLVASTSTHWLILPACLSLFVLKQKLIKLPV